ncbi:MAG: glycosyltransferase [Cyanobacteria bacterium P01_D01_bin.156]
MVQISVVVPAYNAESTIKETIQSVLVQTFTDFELIIINDGSTDRTQSIVESFSDTRIRSFTFSNAGPQKSRNRGIERSIGEYISFLDADDLWTPDKLESQLTALNDMPEAGVAYSWTDVIDEEGKFVRRGGHLSYQGNILLELALVNFLESGSNPLIKTSIIRAIDGFDEDILAGQDWDTWLRLAATCKFTVVRKSQVLYRKTFKKASWSSKIKRQLAGCQHVMHKLISQSYKQLDGYKNHIFANCYRYLLAESLQRQPSRKQTLLAGRILGMIVFNDPLFVTKKVFLKVLARMLVLMAFGQNTPLYVSRLLNNLLDVTSIYGYQKILTDHSSDAA